MRLTQEIKRIKLVDLKIVDDKLLLLVGLHRFLVS